jgi:hypothetical protein
MGESMATATDKALQQDDSKKAQPKQHQPQRARHDDKLKIFCSVPQERGFGRETSQDSPVPLAAFARCQ